MKTYFFGWGNIKWFIREIGKMYSNQESYFSKKRIESGIAFIAFEWGMITWFIANLKINSSDLAIWAGIQLAIAGYMINKIQDEKKDKEKNEAA